MSPADEWKLLNGPGYVRRAYKANAREIAHCKTDPSFFGLFKLSLTDDANPTSNEEALPSINPVTSVSGGTTGGGAVEGDGSGQGADVQELAGGEPPISFASLFDMSNADVSTFVFTDDMRKSLIELDLSGNLLRSGSLDLESMSQSWLRGLNLSGNRFAVFPKFVRPTRLLRLDLSFNKALSGLPGGLDKIVPHLRDLNLEGCALESLGVTSVDVSSSGAAGPQEPVPAVDSNALAGLRFLEKLNVALNRLPLQELTKILQLRPIRSLGIHSNPGCQEPAADQALFSMLPKKLPSLKEIDGAQTRLVGGKVMLPGGGAGASGGFSDGVLAEDSASCSCLEGNPCAVSYNCRDWANRFEVARRHRQQVNK